MRKSIYTRNHERLCGILKTMREEAGLTQVQLAKKLKRPQSFVSKYESGQRRLDLVELKTVCEALGTDLRTLVRRFERG